MRISFDNSYTRLPDRLYRPVRPATAPAPKLIRFNHALADELGIDVAGLSDGDLAALFGGARVPDGAAPIAMAYAGHQFGHFNPQLGDGRALLLGEVVDREGRRRDIHLKGSGETPFSRNGDGKAALGPVIREYIVSEAMHALGIPTTRALAAVLTGEPVIRETVLPGAVFTRVASSHIRIGTFQYFAAREDHEAVRALADHAIARHYPELVGSESPYLGLLKGVADRQARLIARWMAVGFIHGVMNTDNMTISGETIDFGPCAFMDAFDPMKVFSSIDRQGRYAYSNQPGIGQWNLARLAEALLPLLDADQDRAVEAANAMLVEYGRVFQDAWLNAFRAKLGLTGEEEGDLELVNDLLTLMHQGEADFTLAFRALGKLAGGVEEGGFTALLSAPADPAPWLARWHMRRGATSSEVQAAMEAVNPAVIPRNHRIEEAIQTATYDDFSFFERLHAALAEPYAEKPAYADYLIPPTPEQVVTRTFCGT
ncbi:protein adenylyltransferase SelO [Ciceribacter sp. L1K22]|uniref:protein adenylyltransferase SelO n=1 Tax=Ciceribacter sp. L1K22 TaxID=2820275 RepID=UPI001ABDE45A|nr:YdiU family protein [Ciceribacter sp. L1K22]MBO3761090.1 YdiU family protein [Ciceribacter sp. L1K22]